MGYVGPVSSVVTLSGSVANALPSLGTGQTLVSKGITSGATGQTIHTVTAGKTFFCLGISYGANAGDDHSLRVGGTIKHYNKHTTGPMCYSGGIIFTANANDAITYNFTGAINTAICWMWGYEV